MSKEDKQAYNEKRLSRFTGGLLLAVCACMMTLPIGNWLGIMWLGTAGIIALLICVFVGAVFTNKSRYFRVQGVAVLTTDPTEKRITIVILSLAAVVLLVVGAIIFIGMREPTVNIGNDSLEITGMYGTTIRLSDITGVTLIEQTMFDIGEGQRTNGIGGLGQTLRGNFTSQEYGLTLLFTQGNSSPTIYIETEGRGSRDIFISFRDGAKTEQLYNEIITAMR